MTSTSCDGFYASYADYKGYRPPNVGRKQVARFDAEIWRPAQCLASHSFLELGCGTGAFLAYLAGKNVGRFHGIDHDPALAQVIPENVRERFTCRDVWETLADDGLGRFDRVVILDVLEHFSPEDAARLLTALRPRLEPQARVIVKVPNVSSPWALQWQFGDLTHRTAFNPLSLKQLAGFAGYDLAAVWPQRQGSRRRMVTDALVHRFLSWALLTPPPLWSANFYGMLVPR
ncbi:methyltransferase domain-containing protein [Magnetospirillum aberrantis]|uniref:Class I SAM-dependent methyltransferase n=1 Tax=Magnetospirillum aberrantis SpK TaxID=908842 RepID=A0A7C9QTD6_9PROT|nr:class I SAM-dependent methyltransferase [Magnetospirillum aberrantis SpK]